MPKLNMTFEFDSMEAAATFLAFRTDVNTVTVSVEDKKYIDAMAKPDNLKVVAAEVPPVDLYAEARTAMTDYIQRGNGRTALTAKEIQTAHGLTHGIKNATLEQLPALIAAYKSA